MKIDIFSIINFEGFNDSYSTNQPIPYSKGNEFKYKDEACVNSRNCCTTPYYSCVFGCVVRTTMDVTHSVYMDFTNFQEVCKKYNIIPKKDCVYEVEIQEMKICDQCIKW